MRIAWCGLGIMGSRMAVHLVRAGHDVVVWNRTEQTARDWASEHGATVASTPREAADGADVLFTMLVDGPQVAAALEGVTEPLCVDMSTIGAHAARELGQGRRLLDAPVTGSSPKAADGTLTIMVGGADADYAEAEPLLREMGEVILHVGPAGAGQAIKVISNAVAVTNASTLAQALIAGTAAGVDLDSLVQVMANGAANSTMVGLKAQPMLDHDWSTLFKLDHMLKDVRFCLEQTREGGTTFPAAEEVERTLAEASAGGLGEVDFAALTEVLERAAGRRIGSETGR